jgi:hypothetical protein
MKLDIKGVNFSKPVVRSRAVESEGILGGVGVGRNFRWSRSRKEFEVESESEGI